MNTSQKHWLSTGDKNSGPERKSQSSPRAHRKPFWVFGVPVLFLILLIAVFAYVFRDRLLPAVPVEFVPAIAVVNSNVEELGSDSSNVNTSNQLLFQATGWIEPDPFPIRVTPLYSGVVRDVHVLEGQEVSQGQLLVSIVDDDAKLVVRRAKAELAQAVATEETLRADLERARTRQKTASHNLESELAVLGEFTDTVKRLDSLMPGTISEQNLVQAQQREKKQSANVAAAAALVEEWKAEAAWVDKQIQTQKQLIAAAEVVLEEAELALSRTQVLSPLDGIVLRLLATPGKRLMLTMDHPDSSTAVIMYEANKLQVRVDVPLADAGKLMIGQRVQVNCSLLPNQTFNGKVTRIVGEADVQRNTLQTKVQIEEPDPRLRPEMLCRAEFYGSPLEGQSGANRKTESGNLTVYVPDTAVVDRDGQTASIWVVSTDHRHAERRAVKIGAEPHEGGDLPVLEGIRPGERVIIHPPSQLKDGRRINPLKSSTLSP